MRKSGGKGPKICDHAVVAIAQDIALARYYVNVLAENQIEANIRLTGPKSSSPNAAIEVDSNCFDKAYDIINEYNMSTELFDMMTFPAKG